MRYLILCLLLVGCAEPADRVYCPKCHKALVKEDKVCPKDSAPLNGYLYWFWANDRQLPKMAYPAKTYLIKKDGEFIWYPYEVDLHDVWVGEK